MQHGPALPAFRALVARLADRGGAARPAAPHGARGDGPPPARLDIAVCEGGSEAAAQARIRLHGRRLARQDRWDQLARALREADQGRARTPGAVPVARLLAEGAAADALEAALAAADRADVARARGILQVLEQGMEGLTADPWLAALLAQAHLAMARVWQGRPGAPDPTPARREARAQHLEAAARLVAPFEPLELDSPLLAALRCALLDRAARPGARVADDYEDLIDLDPGSPEHMRALGRDLHPARFGSWRRLDLEARGCAQRTADLWGAGGYVWVWMDVLAGDSRGFAHVEAELFSEGLHDILARRDGQHMANLLAAYCGLTLSGAAGPGTARARITGALGWILRDHLREIHPELWAEARPGAGSGDTALRRGKVRALSVLAEHFAADLRRGHRVVISAQGLEIRAAG
ncbi:hypothetical protein VK682_20695 [Salipiger manganoxidans]|uniref:hypothetical protein n=1 Tax=Salipiger marinus TaxID=555512 RepID=UPI002D196B06|nr:hypothetical protein [Salipiger manganoxidans]MEB3421006.1 hypothetical protein [Salipiger manganoxidans]